MDKRSHKERYDAGLKTRTEVLGKPWVDKSMAQVDDCLLYTSPSPRDRQKSRMPSSA